MMHAPESAEAKLFEAALERRTPAERAAYLDQACAGKSELRRRVEALLECHEVAGQFMEAAGAERPTITLDLTPEESPGTMIGRYKLLQKIGEGGMGVVYMAEQTEPVVRRVALKIIKLGMDTRAVVARFEAERQALALMDHPNIAKVLDAGTTEADKSEIRNLKSEIPMGRPYFVMELVHGVPLTEYCDKNKLTTKERLELFIPVCQAIQHAHHKGIIHRDIKPSNVMVTLHDGVPVPKVIDFGVAKATNQRLTEKTLFTNYAQMIGTPAYMSPEQAEMSGLDIDTRSDIYSLGVLLYELLTGTTPFDAKELLSKGYAEMQRIIVEQEPAKPSTRMSTLTDEQRTVVASQRSTEVSALRKVLRGDLDWIVMKCLEKDRTRRYETSNGLAADLRRHLNNELITARPPTTGYLLKKLIKRNKAAFVTAGLVIAVLVVGMGVATWQYFQQKAATARAVAAEDRQQILRQHAEAEQAKAAAEAVKSRQVSRFLKGMLEGFGPDFAPRSDRTILKEILDQSVARAGKEFADQPEVRAEVLTTIGISYLELGEYRKSEAAHREALRLRRERFGQANGAVAESLNRLANALLELRALSEAEACLQEALAIQVNLFGRTNAEVARTLTSLAAVTAGHELWAGAEEENLLREALAIQRRIYLQPHQDLVDTLALLALYCGSSTESEALNREGLALSRQLKGEDNQDAATFLSRLSVIAKERGRLKEAEAMAREALAMHRKVLGNDHRHVCFSLENLSRLLEEQGRSSEAEVLLREALATREKTHPEDWETFDTRSRLGQMLMDRTDLVEAGPLVLSAYEAMRRSTNEFRTKKTWAAFARVVRYYDSVNTNGGVTVSDWFLKELEFNRLAASRGEASGANGLFLLGWSLIQLGKGNEGRLLLLEAAERGGWKIWNSTAWELAINFDPEVRNGKESLRLAERAVAATNRKDADVLDTLAAAHADNGQFADAVRVEEEAIAVATGLAAKRLFTQRRKRYEAHVPLRMFGGAMEKVQGLLQQGKFAEAEALGRDCLRAAQGNDARVFQFQTMLGDSLLGQQKYGEAESLLKSAYESLVQREDAGTPMGRQKQINTLDRLMKLYEATGQREQATEWKAKIQALADGASR